MARALRRIVDPKGPAYITATNRHELSPFVLFDAGLVKVDQEVWGFDWHPHSGVGTLTIPFHGDLSHMDSGGNEGLIIEGGFQWMQAGGGIWHQEQYQVKDGKVGVMQLWVRLGPEEETAPNQYFDRQPEDIQTIGNVRLLVGRYQGYESSHTIPADITYLDVKLNPGEVWTFDAPESQTRGFAYPIEGSFKVEGEKVSTFQLGHFVDSRDRIEVHADPKEGCRFVLALAAPSPFPIVHEYGQIHTNRQALQVGKENIKRMRIDLQKKGVLR